MKNVLLFLSLLFFTTSLIAQKPTGYYDSGQIKWLGNFNLQGTDTIKQGHWIYYHPNGQLAASGYFRDNRKHGDWKLYHTNGVVKDIANFSNDLMEGGHKEFNEIGTLIRSESHRNGLLDGDYKEFYTSGVLKMSGNYSRGQRIGKWSEYASGGSLQAVNTFKVIIVEEDYLSVKHGPSETYQPNGQLLEKGQYVEGMRVGKWQFFYPTGIMKEQAVYENGEKTSTTKYNASGQVIQE